jgi:hypothetical protein
MTPEEKIKNQAEQIKVLEELVRQQKRQLTIMQESLEKKNRALDAMHYVWCDGGCPGGVHRYKDMKDIPLTEDIVRKAEYNVLRLRTWFGNWTYRNGKYQRAPRHWKIILWLAGISWKRFIKRWEKEKG